VLKAHNDKAEKSEKNEKNEKSEKSERLLKADKADKAEKSEKSDKSDKIVKVERQEKAERASERLERAERAERAAAPPLPTKSPFPKDELGKWRVQLLSRRYEISSDIAGLEKDAMEAEDGHTTPNHLAERGSDADLQDVSLGIAGEEKDIIWQIDRALRKIDESEPIPFGLCEFTKEAIPRSRLQLIPWTPLSIEGATHMEQKGLQVEDMLVDG
jgi:DnaK suppressor protein